MDLVSNLPDEILCHVLSYLPTKQAVLTSVLSKRWLNLWKLVTDLDIDDSVFLHQEEGKSERQEIRHSFVSFVEGVLALQGDSPIKKFSLKCISGIHPDTLNTWICNVLKRGVSDLVLFIDFWSDDIEEDSDDDVVVEYNLPQELFFSKTIVNLKLRSGRCVSWWHYDRGAHLSMLKSLLIDSALICCGNTDTFIRSFPVLEDLRMANMEWMDSEVTMSSASLKELKILATGCEEFENPERVSFDTPSLVFLSYSDLVAEDYPLVNMKNLSMARIELILIESQIVKIRAPNNNWLGNGEDDVVLRFGNVVKLMNGIQNVHTLSLYPDTLEVLSLCCETMPVFNNLKMLGITSVEDRGWQAMPALLRNCPHLETIILEGLIHHVTDKCGDVCPCISREEKGRSLTSCPVKMIEIQGFRATMKEMNMIKHFLDYFPCLKEMRVLVEEHEPTQLKNREISKLIEEMFGLYDSLSSCNVQLMVSRYLEKKWISQGSL